MGELHPLLERKVPVAELQRAFHVDHETVTCVLEGIGAGAVPVDEGVACANLDIRVYLVVEAEGALQAVESPEVIVKAHLLFKRDVQPPNNFLV